MIILKAQRDQPTASGILAVSHNYLKDCICNRSESDSLAELRDRLLPKLMSGQIRVKDAEKLVEEVL